MNEPMIKSEFNQNKILLFTNNINTIEKERFTKSSPFITLLKLSTGPLIYFIGMGFHDAFDLFLISKAYGSNAVQTVGFGSLIRYLSMSLAIFFSQACVARISGLIGESRFNEAGQIVGDLFTMSFFSMFFSSFLFYFLTKPIMSFMGCTEEISELSKIYLLPILISMPFISLFQLSCGVILAEGRSILNGILQLLAFSLNCFFFGPIFLFYFKLPFKYSGLAFALSQSLPGIILFILIFNNFFGIKIKFSYLFKIPNNETILSLKLGLPFILSVITGSLPPMVLINYMMASAKVEGLMNEVGIIYSVFLKIQALINSFSLGFSQGLLSTGSYSHGAKENIRLIKLFWSSIIITLIFQFIFLPLIFFKSDFILNFWISNKNILNFAKSFIKIPFYTNWLTAINEVITCFLLSIKKSNKALYPSIVRGFLYIFGSILIYYTNKNNSKILMFEYCLNDIIIFIIDLFLIWNPYKESQLNCIQSDNSCNP